MSHSYRPTTQDQPDNNTNSYKNQVVTLASPTAYQNREHLTAAPDELHEVTLDGFRIAAIRSLPADARLKRGSTKVNWLDVECGGWAQLDGACQLYVGRPGAVIARVKHQAQLKTFDSERTILLTVGLWRISPPQ